MEPVVFPATGTSEDVAMLLADDKGATLIVAVGTHVTLVEFLDKGRSGHGQHLPHPAAGRRQAGRRQGGQPALPGADLLPQPRRSCWSWACCALGAALWSTDGGRALLQVFGARIDDLWSSIQGVVRLIDFRYHLVSIVSIFLALAVGIVLGAGPLKGELGDTLNKEVAGLRQDKADLNRQLQEARAGTEARDAYIADTNPIMLAGVLQDRRVALVVLPGSDAAVSEATAATLRSSGAAVVSTTSVSEDWVTSDDATATTRDAAVTAAAAAAGVDISDSGSVAPRDVLLASLLTVPAADPSSAPGPRDRPEGPGRPRVRRPDPDRHRGLRARRPRRRRVRGDHPG